jgi:polyisoprenoid-binding protein YceI
MKVKNIIIPFIAAFTFSLMGILALPANAAETYKLDPDHTSVVFRIKHLGVGNVYGSFAGATGSLEYDESTPSNNSIEIQVGAVNVYTAVEKRDNHLRSPDFFHTKKYPKISFKSTSAKKIDNTSFELSKALLQKK